MILFRDKRSQDRSSAPITSCNTIRLQSRNACGKVGFLTELTIYLCVSFWASFDVTASTVGIGMHGIAQDT